MQIKVLIGSILLAASVAAPLSCANANSYSVSFSANSFTNLSGYAAPVDPVTGSFDITFDPTLTYINVTTGISLNNLNITLGSALSFDYDPSTDRLYVGGLENSAASIPVGAANDFWLYIYGFTSAPVFYQAGYKQILANVPDAVYYYTLPTNPTGSVSVTSASAVPAPAALPLLASGLGGLGLLGWRRKRKAAALGP